MIRVGAYLPVHQIHCVLVVDRPRPSSSYAPFCAFEKEAPRGALSENPFLSLHSPPCPRRLPVVQSVLAVGSSLTNTLAVGWLWVPSLSFSFAAGVVPRFHGCRGCCRPCAKKSPHPCDEEGQVNGGWGQMSGTEVG